MYSFVSLIWLLLLDLDGTLWDHKDISSLELPFIKLNEDTISDLHGTLVRLNYDIVKLLKWARGKGAITSTLSWNIPEKAIAALKAFDVIKYFDYLAIENTDRKDLILRKLLKKIKRERGITFKHNRIIYIDDLDIYVRDIYENIGKIHFLQVNVDFSTFNEAINIISKLLEG